jgi:hypothetical protein
MSPVVNVRADANTGAKSSLINVSDGSTGARASMPASSLFVETLFIETRRDAFCIRAATDAARARVGAGACD